MQSTSINIAEKRIIDLVDKDSFIEIESHSRNDDKSVSNDGVITGYASINGVNIYIYSQNPKVSGGSVGEIHSKKIIHIMKLALKEKCPLIGINQSSGGRIQEGHMGMYGHAQIFRLHTQLSGVVPQISLVFGACAGGAAYGPALTDFIFTVKESSFMFVTGPKVVSKAVGKKVTMHELGGTDIHSKYSGLSHFTLESEEAVFTSVRKLMGLLPINGEEAPTRSLSSFSYSSMKETLDLKDYLPADRRFSYDMRKIINHITDDDSFMEVQEEYGTSGICGFAVFSGYTCGIIANQPKIKSGCLDSETSIKFGRFIRFCDSFNIPILTLVDTPGYYAGSQTEKEGIIRNGAKLLYSYAESSVNKLTIVIRRAYGGAYAAMGSKGLGIEEVYAWPTAEIAIMGMEAAASILVKEQENINEFYKDYKEKYHNPQNAVNCGIIKEVIEPNDTRALVVTFLEEAYNSKLNSHIDHGNIPL